MSAFDFEVLLLPGGLIFMLCLVVTYKVTKYPAIAISAAGLKAVLFLVYFGLVFDGTYTFLDDWTYLSGGERLLDENVGIFNLVDKWLVLLGVGGGDHVLYYLYNTYAFRLFGIGYFAPVAYNILLTIGIAFLGSRLAVREFSFSSRQGKFFYLFLLFQPDILAWSNIMNGKDILVLLLHILLLQAIALFYRNCFFKALLIALPVIVILTFLRFYVPFLFLSAMMITTFITGHLSLKLRLFFLLFGMIFMVSIFLWVGVESFQYAFLRIQEDMVNPFYGFVRMLLTPIPFNTETAYAFLNIPALLHWLMLPVVVLGLLKLRKIPSIFSLYFLVYACSFISLSAVYGELQGPRHRIQLDYFFAVLQFMGFLTVASNITNIVKKKGNRRVEVSQSVIGIKS